MIEKIRYQKGSSIIELLVGVLFTAIVAMATAKSTMLAERLSEKTNHRSVAMQLVIETIESYGTINPESFSTSTNPIESKIIKEGIEFKRKLTFATNPDRSRSITVSVTDPVVKTGFTITQTGTFALWGAR